MKNIQSPILEKGGSGNIPKFLIIMIAALVCGFLFFFSKPEKIPKATPVIEETEMETDATAPSSASIEATKMNVFYIGVENPITVKVPGVSSNNIQVSITGGGATIQKADQAGSYIVYATTPNNCKVTVTTNGYSYSENFRIKRVPNPNPTLSLKKDGPIGVGEFRAQKGLSAKHDKFDFDDHCKIVGYQISRIVNNQMLDPVINPGNQFSEESTRLIKAAQPGDTYIFNRIKARCSGDKAARQLNSMVFLIR